MFTSNRNGFKPPKRLPHTSATVRHGRRRQQRRVHRPPEHRHGAAPGRADGRPRHVQLARVAGAAHLDRCGACGASTPTAPNWEPVVSAFLPGAAARARSTSRRSSPTARIVVEEYYNQNNSGFGTLREVPAARRRTGTPAFGPGYTDDPRNPPLRHGRLDNGQPRVRRLPFSPYGIESLTPFARTDEGAGRLRPCAATKTRPRVGKVTHPSGAPDNHLLTVWSPGPVNGGYTVHQPDGRRRHLPDQGRQGRSTSRARCC